MSDPYFANVVLLAINDNAANGTTTFADQSNSAHTINDPSSLTTYSNLQAPTGMTTSALFSAASLNCADSADWDFGSGDFTVEFMFYPSTTIGNAHNLIGQVGGNYPRTNASFGIIQQSTNPAFYATSDNINWDIASNQSLGSGAGSIAANNWYHGAVTRSGTTFNSFLNGVLSASTNTSSAAIYNSTDQLTIGNVTDLSTPFSGYMACIRITKGVARYTANFTPPSLPLPNTGPSAFQRRTLGQRIGSRSS